MIRAGTIRAGPIRAGMIPKTAAALLLLLPTVVAARETIGIYQSWGAFADAVPPRCFAIAQPVAPTRAGSQPFASIATWPKQGRRNQLHIRLSRPRAPHARVTLSVGERRFDLIAATTDAWAADRQTDLAIVGAMRAGRSMSVETQARSGQPFADVYALRGAATAIDAAALRCLGG